MQRFPGKARGHRRVVPTRLLLLRVRRLVGDPARGQVLAGRSILSCALGRSGIACAKREGDGVSPRGTFRLLAAFYRPDRLRFRPRTGLPLTPVARDDGWCDDPRDRRYNRPVRLPCGSTGAERMWREDGLYDVVIDIDYNRNPVRRHRGSAIFLHVARPGYAPTEGCVALARSDLLRLLPLIGPATRLTIG